MNMTDSASGVGDTEISSESISYEDVKSEGLSLDDFICEGVISVIGSGGKTTLIEGLARKLRKKGSVIVCTSTKILPPDYCRCIIVENEESHSQVSDNCEYVANDEACEQRVSEIVREDGIVAVGTEHITKDGILKLSAPGLSFALLSELADFVLVEADGSKRLPVKAHEEYEPVIPEDTNLTVLVVGGRGFGKKISDTVHRPDVFAELAECSVDDIVTPENLAKVINEENLCDVVFFSQVSKDNLELFKQTEDLLNQRAIYGEIE